MVLSDRHIREQLESGGIVIDPLGEGCIQPSSVDLHVDRLFRVFRNDTTPFIDPKAAQEDLTELVEVDDGNAFILHPGEFVLGSTLERVALGNDLVARLEGKSSLGRLGLLIHSSLPATEEIMVRREGRVEMLPIGEVVESRLRASVASFDPETFEVGYHEITGWYEGPPDRIYDVRLASGRSVRVTAGHNFFSLDSEGNLMKTRTGQLQEGTRVAIPRYLPDPSTDEPSVRFLDFIPEGAESRLVCRGDEVAALFETCRNAVKTALHDFGVSHLEYYEGRGQLPLPVMDSVAPAGWRATFDGSIALRGSRHFLPAEFTVDDGFAWMLGMYVAEGSIRAHQFNISNTDEDLLDRVERVLGPLGIPVYRTEYGVTGCSGLFAMLLEWIGVGVGSRNKRIPPLVFSWHRDLLERFMEGLVDGDGSWEPTRTSVWTCSDRLATDVLLLAERLGRRAGSSVRRRGDSKLWQIYMPLQEHKLLTSVPLPHRLLVELRESTGMDQLTASRAVGYRHATDLCNLERRSGREAVRVATLQRLRRVYARRPGCSHAIDRLNRLVDGDLLWDRVVEVRDTGSVEPIYDLEVRPGGRKIENFLAGSGGVFVSNTAGFVDAGWDGHLTLELSNVANLPIAIYPGMKIGQISFLQMSSEAENPYGGDATASKYKGQQGPTPSRYYLNFPEDDRHG